MNTDLSYDRWHALKEQVAARGGQIWWWAGRGTWEDDMLDVERQNEIVALEMQLARLVTLDQPQYVKDHW